METPQITTTELGTTGLEITRVGFGAWAIGSGWEFGWGLPDDKPRSGRADPRRG